jgi:hypothetical protein
MIDNRIAEFVRQYDRHTEEGNIHEAMKALGELHHACKELIVEVDEGAFYEEREKALDYLEFSASYLLDDGEEAGYRCKEVNLEPFCVKLADVAMVLSRPAPRPSRWVVLPFTSGSGKTMFRCGVCGRLSVTPDKACPDNWGCDRYTGYPPVGVKTTPKGFK